VPLLLALTPRCWQSRRFCFATVDVVFVAVTVVVFAATLSIFSYTVVLLLHLLFADLVRQPAAAVGVGFAAVGVVCCHRRGCAAIAVGFAAVGVGFAVVVFDNHVVFDMLPSTLFLLLSPLLFCCHSLYFFLHCRPSASPFFLILSGSAIVIVVGAWFYCHWHWFCCQWRWFCCRWHWFSCRRHGLAAVGMV